MDSIPNLRLILAPTLKLSLNPQTVLWSCENRAKCSYFPSVSLSASSTLVTLTWTCCLEVPLIVSNPGAQLPRFGQPISPAVYAATIKLPDFWQHNPEPWFQHVEAHIHFQDHGRQYKVLPCRGSSSTTRRIMGLLRDPPEVGNTWPSRLSSCASSSCLT